MENLWNAIVKNLSRSKQKNVDEDTYQDTIECQLQLLGWLEGVESRPALPNGASKTLIPDIVLNKDGHRVLPIEIKRPDNTLNARQASQLSSYMRRLRLLCGVYIGENIQLYYDTPEDDSDAISVCTIELEENNPLGRKLCSLLACENFDEKAFEDFCIEQLRMKNARNDFRKRIQEYVSPQTASQNILELLRDKFSAEGFESPIIDAELKKLSIKIDYQTELMSASVSKQIVPNKKVKGDCKENASTLNNFCVSEEQKLLERFPDSVDNIFVIKNRKGIEARAIYKDGKMIVLKDSIFTSVVKRSFTAHTLREEVISKSEKLPNGHYRLLEDFCFSSPSTASQIIYGASTSGWVVWKTENGKTLSECVRKDNLD